MVDSICEAVQKKMHDKYVAGVEEHGGLTKATTDFKTWVLAIQEEAIDTACYCEKILQDMK